MAVFAIADLHLSHVDEKSMDIFGRHWKGHWDKIQEAWRSRIGAEDLVLIPGDISWAMHMPEAQPDLDAIGRMPGQKLILRGNHDYWWSSLTQVRSALPEGMYALQNDCFAYRGQAVCGARGWVQGNAAQGEKDAKLLRREVGRLRLSLQSAADKGLPIALAMFHFPRLMKSKHPMKSQRCCMNTACGAWYTGICTARACSMRLKARWMAYSTSWCRAII